MCWLVAKGAHRTVTSASGERTPKGALDRRLKVCAQNNLCTNESELRDNPLSVRIGHATQIYTASSGVVIL